MPANKQRSSEISLFSIDSLPEIEIPAVRAQPGQFASALAHEVRNPLSNINLALELLKSTVLDNEQKMYMDIIIRGSGRISEVVVDLLTYFEADETQAEKHCIHDLLEEIIAMTADRIMMKEISIIRNYAEPDHAIMVNKQQIMIALTNIIINAIEAMPAENGRLTFTTKTIDNKRVVEIADNGCGISEEKLKTIFEPYITNKPGGMGLGLSTTMEILLSHHASMDVQSELGKGTTFILSFESIQHAVTAGI
ncbi:MAG: ATP-binding protein [Ferruginibacter sp.]